MTSSRFMYIDKVLTRKPDGKLDCHPLPTPLDGSGLQSAVQERLPTTLEAKLVELWRRALGLAHVGLDEDFFELGGASLLAVRLTMAIQQRFGLELSLETLFAPIVAGLAATLQVDPGEVVGLSLETLFAPIVAGLSAASQVDPEQVPGEISNAPIGAAPRKVNPPASFGQEMLWVLDRLEPRSAIYNVPIGLRLQGELNLTALRAALDTLVARHEALRTTLATVDGQLRQVIRDPAGMALRIVSVEDIPDAGRVSRAYELAAEETRRPFDLEVGPLVRAALVRLDATDHVLALVLHLSICDGRSSAILLGELGMFYTAQLMGQPSPFQPLPIQYGDFAHWQRQTLTDSRRRNTSTSGSSALPVLHPC